MIMIMFVRNYEMFAVFSVFPSESWTCLDSRSSRKTPLSSCASTIATRNYSITSISASLSSNKWVCFNSIHVLTQGWTLQIEYTIVAFAFSRVFFVWNSICVFKTLHLLLFYMLFYWWFQFTLSKLCSFSSVMLKHNLTTLHQPSAHCCHRAKEFTCISLK